MYLRLQYIVLALVAIAYIADGYRIRRKRLTTSDHRIAELEAIKGLSQIKGIAKEVKLGYGLRDPKKLGRRRRSDVTLETILDRLRLMEQQQEEAEEEQEMEEQNLEERQNEIPRENGLFLLRLRNPEVWR